MVSIIIPTYNGSKVINRYSLPSLLQQTYTDWEALIIDDGSEDNSQQIIKQFIKKDVRLRLIEQKDNLGLAAALNQGVKQAQGKYIFIFEHDDIWLPNKIEKQLSALVRGAYFSTCNSIVYHSQKNKFTNINGGNLSCLSFDYNYKDILFPLPEENKKYLGIEDGIIAAKLEIAKANGQINNNNLIHINEVLAIMNSGESTLSGIKNSKVMIKRYSSAINLYKELQGKYAGLDKLINFWKKHLSYNLFLNNLPNFLKKIIYYLVNKLKSIKNKRRLVVYQKKFPLQYQKLKTYRQLFN